MRGIFIFENFPFRQYVKMNLWTMSLNWRR